MKKNKVYVVTPVQIENWDEGGAHFLIVFARSKTQAAAAYAAEDLVSEGFGLDEANPDDPYVYEVKIPARRLRLIMGDYDYRQFVLDPGTGILSSPEDEPLVGSIMRIFMGEANHDHHHR